MNSDEETGRKEITIRIIRYSGRIYCIKTEDGEACHFNTLNKLEATLF